MSDTFKPRYEFDVSAHKSYRDPHVYICCEGFASNDGEGSLRFWVETRFPESYDWETQTSQNPHTVTSESMRIYSYDLITKSRADGNKDYLKSDSAWHLREMVIALARGEVAGKSAGSMIYHVFFYTVVKKKPKWLIEGAPEWWALLEKMKMVEAAA